MFLNDGMKDADKLVCFLLQSLTFYFEQFWADDPKELKPQFAFLRFLSANFQVHTAIFLPECLICLNIICCNGAR